MPIPHTETEPTMGTATPSPQATQATQATRWRAWRHRPRRHLYLDARAGRGVTNGGESFTCAPGLPLSELAWALPTQIEAIYLTGPLPEAPQVAREDGELYGPFNSWIAQVQPCIEQMHLDSGTMHDEVFVRLRRLDGSFVDLRTVAAWFGTNTCTPDEAHDALRLVTRLLQGQYGWQDVCLLNTPAGTGLELWHSSIPTMRESGWKQSTAYPILPEDVRTLIHQTSGQGRFEFLPAPPSGVAPQLVCMDGRLAYGAPALNELGVGPATHDTLPVYEGFTPARYRVRFRIPDAWAHVGLFMVPDYRTPEAGGPHRDGKRHWYFPATPGTVGKTWADAAEMRIAYAPFPHACEMCGAYYRANDGERCPAHGWDLHIEERIVFTKGRPLRTWVERLIAAREACGEDSQVHALARAAVRNILLHTIGAFHGTHRPITRIAGLADVPMCTPARTVLSPGGDELHLWDEPGLAPKFPDYQRPEWSAQVWARTRARLLLHRDYDTGRFTGALTLPYEDVAAFRLDAMYLTCDPGWPDSGRPGTLRVKGSLASPVPWPRDEGDLSAVKAQLEGGKGK